MAITNYQGGADTIFDYRNINRVAERELGRKASVAQATAKRQEDQAKEIAGMMAKINQDGLRNADIPKFSQKYGEIQTLAGKIRTATTIEERATASAEFNQKVQGIGLFVNRSKNYSKQLQSVAGDYLKDTQGYSEETGSYYKTQYAKPLDDNTDNDNIDISSFKKLGDVKYVEDRLLGSYKNAGKVEGAIKVGSTLAASSGTTIKNTNQTTQLNRGEIANDLLFQFNNDWQVRDVLSRAYPNAKSPEEKVAAYMIDNRGRETTNNASTINLSNKSAGSGGAGGGASTSDSIVKNQLLNYGRKGTTTTAAFNLQLGEPKKVTSGLFTFVDENGKSVKVDASAKETQVASVGIFPIAIRDLKDSKGNIVAKKGSILTTYFANKNPNAVDYDKKAVVRVANSEEVRIDTGNDYTVYFANPDETLVKVGLSKNKLAGYNELESEFQTLKKSKNNQGNTQKPASSGGVAKEIKSSDIKSRAQASGYTEAEYRKLLKEKNIKIIN